MLWTDESNLKKKYLTVNNGGEKNGEPVNPLEDGSGGNAASTQPPASPESLAKKTGGSNNALERLTAAPGAI